MEQDKLINLVTKAQQGDQDAMAELFKAFYGVVFGFAMDTLKNKETAEDVTQETFLEIFKTIGNLKEPLAFVTWAKRIAYHQCTRYFKKKKDFVPYEDEDGNTIFDDVCDEDSAAIPQEAYEGKELKNTIRGMVDNLSEGQRSAVLLYYYDHLPVTKIAEIQEVSEGTVKSRLNYARKAMEKSIISYEQNSGIRLHGVGFAPLFALGLDAAGSMSQASFMAIQQAVLSGTAATAASASTATAATAGTGTAIAAKIAAGIAATAILAGGTVLGVHLLKKDNTPKEISYTSISAGCEHLVALKNDGTVYATGRNTEGQCNVEDWTDVVAVSAKGLTTVALKSDGTVYATGDNTYGQCDTESWSDIKEVCSGGNFTLGLKSDGTLISAGVNAFGASLAVSSVKDVASIEIYGDFVAYTTTKGESSTTNTGHMYYDGLNSWQDIKMLSANSNLVAGLTKDGNVLLLQDKSYDYDTSDWTDIDYIDLSCESMVYTNIMEGGIENLGCIFDLSIGMGFEQKPCVNIVGVSKEGKVFYEGNNIFNDMSVIDTWTDITSVAAGDIFCAGLKEDGTVVLAGNNEDNSLDVSDWTDIKVYE